MTSGQSALEHIKKKLAATPGSDVTGTGMTASGRDNRTPFVGGTKFPTEGSKNMSQSLLAQSSSSAEVGPSPSATQLNKENLHSMRDASVKQVSPVGSLPKIGADMSITKDPLIQYFATQPGQEEFKKYAEALEDNINSMPTSKEEKERVSENISPSRDSIDRSNNQIDSKLKELFDNYPTEKKVIS